ncbi:PAS domain-containing protein [Desulfotalea psychrophila]|uniref:Related to sensory transduction histidine kinases (Partial length) n=1 Tax=Desulfotalea psychrophila (strain LSv54 / DSM 12343) TaxID=177439 RepID=Q6ARP8_DESPS|nr:PAS domain-containing protein [Desulfotalea psychrophila]CAG34977.1 related to sensory transduction histidine kinases (partial length) [Desulfotalea psychrophila LSv54]
MKTENKIISLAILMGLFICAGHVMVDYLLFNKGSFIEFLATDISKGEIFIRILVLVCFVLFGLVSSRLITKQKAAEQKLAASLYFQQQLLDRIPVPIFYKDEECIYVGCNKSYEDFMDMPRKEIIGKSVYDIAPANLANIYHKKDSDLINKPGTQIYEFEVKSKTHASNRQVILPQGNLRENRWTGYRPGRGNPGCY